MSALEADESKKIITFNWSDEFSLFSGSIYAGEDEPASVFVPEGKYHASDLELRDDYSGRMLVALNDKSTFNQFENWLEKNSHLLEPEEFSISNHLSLVSDFKPPLGIVRNSDISSSPISHFEKIKGKKNTRIIWRKEEHSKGDVTDQYDIKGAQDLLKEYAGLGDVRIVQFPDYQGLNIYVADLGLQPTQSFKPWISVGMIKAALSDSNISMFVSATAGNQGIAMAYVTKILSERLKRRLVSVLYVGQNASQTKIERMKEHDAIIISAGVDEFANYDEANIAAQNFAQENGDITYFVEHGDVNAVEGYAALGKQIFDQLEHQGVDLTKTAAITPVGSGGLGSGMGVAADSRNQGIKTVYAQTDKTKHASLSLLKGKLKRYEHILDKGILADGINTKILEQKAFDIINALADGFVVVSEKRIEDQIVNYILNGVKAEESAVIPYLAMTDTVEILRDQGVKNVILLSTGSNISDERIQTLMKQKIANDLLSKHSSSPIEMGDSQTLKSHLKWLQNNSNVGYFIREVQNGLDARRWNTDLYYTKLKSGKIYINGVLKHRAVDNVAVKIMILKQGYIIINLTAIEADSRETRLSINWNDDDQLFYGNIYTNHEKPNSIFYPEGIYHPRVLQVRNDKSGRLLVALNDEAVFNQLNYWLGQNETTLVTEKFSIIDHLLIGSEFTSSKNVIRLKTKGRNTSSSPIEANIFADSQALIYFGAVIIIAMLYPKKTYNVLNNIWKGFANALLFIYRINLKIYSLMTFEEYRLRRKILKDLKGKILLSISTDINLARAVVNEIGNKMHESTEYSRAQANRWSLISDFMKMAAGKDRIVLVDEQSLNELAKKYHMNRYMLKKALKNHLIVIKNEENEYNLYNRALNIIIEALEHIGLRGIAGEGQLATVTMQMIRDIDTVADEIYALSKYINYQQFHTGNTDIDRNNVKKFLFDQLRKGWRPSDYKHEVKVMGQDGLEIYSLDLQVYEFFKRNNAINDINDNKNSSSPIRSQNNYLEGRNRKAFYVHTLSLGQKNNINNFREYELGPLHEITEPTVAGYLSESSSAAASVFTNQGPVLTQLRTVERSGGDRYPASVLKISENPFGPLPSELNYPWLVGGVIDNSAMARSFFRVNNYGPSPSNLNYPWLVGGEKTVRAAAHLRYLITLNIIDWEFKEVPIRVPPEENKIEELILRYLIVYAIEQSNFFRLLFELWSNLINQLSDTLREKGINGTAQRGQSITSQVTVKTMQMNLVNETSQGDSHVGAVFFASSSTNGDPSDPVWLAFYEKKLDPESSNHQKYMNDFIAHYQNSRDDIDHAWRAHFDLIENSPDKYPQWQIVLDQVKDAKTEVVKKVPAEIHEDKTSVEENQVEKLEQVKINDNSWIKAQAVNTVQKGVPLSQKLAEQDTFEGKWRYVEMAMKYEPTFVISVPEALTVEMLEKKAGELSWHSQVQNQRSVYIVKSANGVSQVYRVHHLSGSVAPEIRHPYQVATTPTDPARIKEGIILVIPELDMNYEIVNAISELPERTIVDDSIFARQIIADSESGL